MLLCRCNHLLLRTSCLLNPTRSEVYLRLLIVIVGDGQQDCAKVPVAHYLDQTLLCRYVFRVQLSQEKIIPDCTLYRFYYIIIAFKKLGFALLQIYNLNLVLSQICILM